MKLKRPSYYQIALFIILAILIGYIINIAVLPRSKDDNTIIVGIVDSGCARDQSSRVLKYLTFTSTEFGYPYNEETPYDTIEHGTYVCQTIIDGTENALIISAKIANADGYVTYGALFEAIKQLVEVEKVDIINLSLGGENFRVDDLQNAFLNYADDVVLIAAVGNHGFSPYPDGIVDWPSTLPWVIGVGAGVDSLQEFSARGVSYQGLYPVEYSADGILQIKFGTSFSTPKITAKFVNAMEELRKQEIELTPGELNYLVSLTASDTFDKNLGWGYPIDQVTINEGIRFVYPNEVETFNRSLGETWTKSIKFVQYGFDIQKIKLSGTAIPDVKKFSIVNEKWGGLINIEFQSNRSGNFQLSIEAGQEQIKYEYIVDESNWTKSVLIDLRPSIDGYLHNFAKYSLLDSLFRRNDVKPIYVKDGNISLTEYDAVLVPKFGQYSGTNGGDFTNSFSDQLYLEYIDYTASGGNLVIFAPEFINEQYLNYYHRLGANLTENYIPTTGDFAYVSNFTQIPELSAVQNIAFKGNEITKINDSQIELGWYKALIFNGVVTDIQYYSVGTRMNIGLGKVYIWSSSIMLENEYYLNNNLSIDRYLVNLIL